METVNITELRKRLPGYLARVRQGERIKISSRGRVIAEIAPSSDPDNAEATRSILRDSLVRYDRPLDPVIDPTEWDVNR